MDFPGRAAGRIPIYAAVLSHTSAERRLCGDQLRITNVAKWPIPGIGMGSNSIAVLDRRTAARHQHNVKQNEPAFH